LDLAVAGKDNAVMMVEAGANEISEEQMLEALNKAHESIKELITFENEFIAKAAKPKGEYEIDIIDEDLILEVENATTEKIENALNVPDKLERNALIDTIKDEVIGSFEEKLSVEEFEEKKGQINQAFDGTLKNC